jgi:acetyl esterase/lipase
MKTPDIIILAVGLCLSATLLGQSAEEISITKDVVYGRAGGVELKLDIGHPVGSGPFPAVLFFHGGGWQQGDKSHMHKWIKKFTSSGYVGVSVRYRFAPDFKWPSQIEDAKQAVRFLRANAKELNIDADRLGVMGESAGGYLALMVGVTSPGDSLEGESDQVGISSRVRAVVSYFSSADFTTPRRKLPPALEDEMQKYYKKSLPEVIADFTGTTDPNDPVLRKISVLPYVDKSDPPVLMFQGDNDPFVSVEQALKMEHALEHANVPHELVLVKGAGHGWTGTRQEETTRKMMEFFDRILKE